MALKALQAFIRHESFGGALLLAAAVLALVVANSGLAPVYARVFDTVLSIRLGDIFAIEKKLLLWINDGLMAVFFFTVGLEIKRELKAGELSSPARALLPAIAALGGMIVPAAIYAALNWSNPTTLNGWAIPAATDIAFALGVLAVLGSRVPASLTVFLLAVAVDGDAATLREFMAARGSKLPFALRGEDPFGALDESRLPLLLAIDADGRLLRHHHGMFTLRTLQELLVPPAH